MNIKEFLSWIPGWLGFLALIIIGSAMLINGITNPNLDHTNTIGFIVFGICSAAIGAFSWIAGASSEITGREGKVGVKVSIGDLPWWAWLVDVGIIIVCVILFFAFT